ncbi:MAG TPA: hypothetical protein VFM70_08135 [Salinimicrobium sp.]|nr:hypothetical protein [Salinimicrobium sp.]
MDLSLILISGALIAGIVVPIYFLIFSGNSDTRRLIKKFNAVAKENNLNIKTREVFWDKVIGIDPDAQKLLILKMEDSDFSSEIIEISNVQQCEPVTDYSVSQNKQQNLETVYLKLKFNSNQHPISICFYDAASSMMPNYEIERVKKWCDLIQG